MLTLKRGETLEFSTETFRPVKRDLRTDGAPTFSEVRRTIGHAQKFLLSQQQRNCLWDFPAYLGPHMISHYMLLMHWMGIESTPLDFKNVLRPLLIRTQLADGSWYQCQDLNIKNGDLNVTVLNYWGLKVSGEPVDSDVMHRAREFILSHGGIEKCTIFTKIVLALYGNISWQDVPYTPYLVFYEQMPINYTCFSQWVIPHIFAIAYLRKLKLQKDFGPRFDLAELRKNKSPLKLLEEAKPNAVIDGFVIKKILDIQQPRGTWGGYTVATLFSLIALSNFTEHHDKYSTEISAAKEKAIKFLNELYFESKEGAYMGHAMDSHYWDTILAGLALAESGYDVDKLKPTADYILHSRNRENGGIPFGYDFEYAPDVDDTSEAILFLTMVGYRGHEVKKATHWLTSMQSRDGGFGAFDKNNNGNFLLRWVTRNLSDSAALFDYSSPDSTGNVLEALSHMGHTRENSETVRRGIKFLRKAQTERGSWFGRWAINHIFGTTCALIGLVSCGEDPELSYIKKACDWLESIQNPDGGWGESTRSYNEEKWIGRGVSTPTQTAWALMALIECDRADSDSVRAGVRYLIDQFSVAGKWVDTCVVGTGHPGVIYLEYPSYPHTFPLIALGKYLKTLRG